MALDLGLDTATEDHTVHFHQLQRGTDRIRNRRVNDGTGDEVDANDIVTGFEVGEGEYGAAPRTRDTRVPPSRRPRPGQPSLR
ncbi:Ku protein [Streptomyces collinus]|uniref:Ku protein n=1 Tax=Streptomyces collinus TaxID=42684 RepID=UPI0033F8CABB